MAADESLSLAETNKLRVSMGLAPLADEGAGEAPDSDDPDAVAERNYSEIREKERRAREEKEAKERLAKARNQRELRAKLQGKGLGDADPAAEGATAADWVKQSRKKAKERQAELEKLRAREKELEDRDREAVYGEDELAGLRVAHGAEDIEEGQDLILTLADKKVLDDDDDELQNVNLAEYKRTKKRLDLKKRGKDAYKYTGYDDEEFENGGQKRGVLSKYDEEIDGVKDGEGFKLGGALPSSSRGTAPSGGGFGGSAPTEQRELNRDLLSLDYDKLEQNDYLQEGEVGFRVKKKKTKKGGKSSSSRRAAAEGLDDDGAAAGDGDAEMANGAEEPSGPAIPTAERRLAREGGGPSESVIDDEDLQAALARQRRAANKKRLQQMGKGGEDMAKRMLEEQQESRRAGISMPVDGTNGVKLEETDDMVSAVKEEDQEDDDDAEGGLVVDSTSEFIRNISSRSAAARREREPKTSAAAAAARRVQDAGPAVKVEPAEDGDIPLDSLEAGDVPSVKVEEDEEEEEGAYYDEEEADAMLMQLDGESADIKPDKGKGKGKSPEVEKDAYGGTADEKFVSGGLATTLALLRQSGQIKAATAEERERERLNKEKEAFLAEARMREAHRELERQRAKAAGAHGANAKDQAQREYENKQRQYEYAQEQVEAFKTYKPSVDIKYHDEFGRTLTPKEAWKDLSHKFHGKGSGVNKRNKLLKKVEEERKKEAMSSGDTPLSATAAFAKRQERLGSATMVIGVGNKNAAPSVDQLLGSSQAGKAGSNSLSKNGKPGSSSSQAGSTANKRRKVEPKVLG